MPSQEVPAGSLVSLHEIHSVTGLNTGLVRYVYSGTFNGIDWECGGGAWDHVDKACFFGGAARRGTICVYVQPFGRVTGSTPGPPDPTPFIQPQLADLRKLVIAGRMGTSPQDTARHFVNLPSCWWLDGTQPHQAFELRIDDPPNLGPGGGGRGLTYTYRIDIGLQRVRWEYGDGASWDGDAGYPYTGAGCSNPHTYERISGLGKPGAVPCPAGYPRPTADDGCYVVQATETYSASITASWFDGARDHVVPMGDMAPFTITPAPTHIRVLQIQGVPVAR
jgi:hypothetical protein